MKGGLQYKEWKKHCAKEIEGLSRWQITKALNRDIRKFNKAINNYRKKTNPLGWALLTLMQVIGFNMMLLAVYFLVCGNEQLYLLWIGTLIIYITCPVVQSRYPNGTRSTAG